MSSTTEAPGEFQKNMNMTNAKEVMDVLNTLVKVQRDQGKIFNVIVFSDTQGFFSSKHHQRSRRKVRGIWKESNELHGSNYGRSSKTGQENQDVAENIP